jgi:hypothetical protein
MPADDRHVVVPCRHEAVDRSGASVDLPVVGVFQLRDSLMTHSTTFHHDTTALLEFLGTLHDGGVDMSSYDSHRAWLHRPPAGPIPRIAARDPRRTGRRDEHRQRRRGSYEPNRTVVAVEPSQVMIDRADRSLFTGQRGLVAKCLLALVLLAILCTFGADAVFIGISMLLPAWRAQPGCELTVVSNAVLQRDDQIGCCFYGPVDGWSLRAPEWDCHGGPTEGSADSSGRRIIRLLLLSTVGGSSGRRGWPSRGSCGVCC